MYAGNLWPVPKRCLPFDVIAVVVWCYPSVIPAWRPCFEFDIRVPVTCVNTHADEASADVDLIELWHVDQATKARRR
jgi:hypothetical protein